MLFRSDRKSTRLNSSHLVISYAVFCLKKKKDRRDKLHPHRHVVPRHSNPPAFGQCVAPHHVRRPEVDLRTVVREEVFFFFNLAAAPEVYTLSLHLALLI